MENILANYIDEYFNQAKNKKFVEVGAGDGDSGSVTGELVKERGYKGVLFESSRRQFLQCHKNRGDSSLVLHLVVSKEDSVVWFHDDPTYPRIVPDQEREISSQTLKDETIQVRTKGLNGLLLDMECADSDLLVLNTYGTELDTFSGIRLNTIKLNMVVLAYHRDKKSLKEILDYFQKRERVPEKVLDDYVIFVFEKTQEKEE